MYQTEPPDKLAGDDTMNTFVALIAISIAVVLVIVVVLSAP